MGHCHVERSSQSHGRHVTAPVIFPAVFMSFPVLATVKNVTTTRPDYRWFSCCYVLRSAYTKHRAKHREPNLVLSERRIFLRTVQEVFCVHLGRTPAEMWYKSVWTNSFKRAEQIEKRRNGRFWNCQVESQTLWGKLRQAKHASKPLT